MNVTRCDLHLHSSASIGNDEWYTRYFGCPESYAEPVRQYELCKQRGMSLVTLTDHDTIAGGLELADRPDFFLSEEITAVFPENGCVMHVLAWNITPAQHDEIQDRRRDIYRLTEYLDTAGIAHGLAHPLLSPNWKLDAEIVEKVLLMFPTLEGVNGLTDRRIEPRLHELLERLTPDVIARLSAKHGLAARGATPHRKALTAGSDDHVQRRGGTVYTEIAAAGLDAAAFVGRCLAGQARLVGRQAHLDAMAMTVTHTTYHHLKERQSERAGYRNPFVDVMEVIAGRDPGGGGDGPTASGFVSSLLEGAARAALAVGKPYDIREVPQEPSEEDDARLVGGIALLSDKVVERALESLIDGAMDFDLYGAFGALRDLAGGLVTAAPPFFAADHFGKQEQAVRRVWAEWRAFPLPPRPERLAVFTDAPGAAGGVASPGARADGREVLVAHCAALPAGVADSPAFHALPAVTSFTPPLGARASFHVPSLVRALQWTWCQGITHVELATPGPVALAGLLVAKVLRLPVTASLHTELSALLAPLSFHPMLSQAARRYLAWFYGRVDQVSARSATTRDALVELGVPAARVTDGAVPLKRLVAVGRAR